ncbi:MAG TPA: phenylalanine--tRNA ligase subunit beta [Chloroflexia bacterium]|nr:phenylalanine--tRNA ligase subunit beta [Chloroflexia bacterium]
MPLRAPLSWLKDFIDIHVTSEELARRLTLAGQEVEHIITIGAEWENIYTGQVTKLEQHPNADRLNLATVEYGTADKITVVTGAPNIEEGQKVVLGLLGSRFIDQHQSPPKWSRLKPAKIRGIQTEGMVMSEAELGLSEEHEGIIVLPPDTPVGLTAQEALGDTILHIDVTPNNGRVLSMIGLSREIKAIFGGELRYPMTDDGRPGDNSELRTQNSELTIEIADPDLCSRYTGTVIRGVKIGPSPEWMQRRITMAGMRPVNNIVDITNYVMLEMGQPLHAFDYNAVAGHKIVVRRAKAGEQITTLDHVRRTLDPNMLVICDPEKPVALAGVMGGLDSEIGTEAGAVVDVLLESAHFDPRSIRRTARLLRLPSEASYRFERFVDPNLTVPALQRAADLMRELGGGTIAQGYVDVYPTPAEPERILFYTSEVERLLGIKLPPTQVADVLRRLDFGVEIPDNADTVGQDTTIVVDVPTYRNDVTIQADLVEEVARITGYDQIPETLLYGGLPPQEVNVSLEAEAHLRDLAVECGMDEVITYSVTWSDDLARLDGLTADDGRQTTLVDPSSSVVRRPSSATFEGRPLVTIVNPVSSRQDVMRPTLLPNMMSTLRENLKMQPETPVRIFELGKVYLTPTIGEIEARREAMCKERDKYPRMKAWDLVPNEDKLPMEPRRLVGMISGPRAPRSLFAPDSASPAAQADFFDAKGVVEQLLHRLHIAGVEWVPANSPLYHPGRSAAIHAKGVELGIVGELHPHLIDQWEIPAERVAAWDLDVEALLSVLPDRVRYKTISPFPPVRQDMAFVVNEDTEAAKVAQAIRKAGGEAVTGVALFDIYRDKPIPEGKKSLAFAVTLNSPEKPLSEDEVARIRKKIEGFLAREFGASLRS